ncbi:DUF5672 family protein [Mucilaginibacter sp. L3T2-6]|uniref:DUF5672 family protein n=1 Tax=Mucilaginibacter sp. L3T2-6 TaxID=3062491 RepID=UPI0026744130|nr:DUF5672 family protein [Mucilaginibacter sp. L3T2-6]MDO3643051.1 DUF5672 family protein [Mucilaginibacter sp. L3T2-6]MDV6215818.1 DUF5672 family protein [Mucilaginibacter sp. L3T2-6]
MSNTIIIDNDYDDSVIITIPIYKPSLTASEKASLMQVFSVLSRYPICFFTFKDLDISEYRKIAGKHKYQITFFDSYYFKNIAGYNNLLCRPVFYKRFENYKYLLIYQLDAWVFKDELKFWCDQNYDYIGAPWFAQENNGDSLPFCLGIGNGGFSLRKVKSHIKVLYRFSYIMPVKTIIAIFFKKIGRHSFKRLVLNLTFDNNSHYLLGKLNLYEDIFWGEIIKKNYRWFKAPDTLTAARFSTEINSEMIYNINKQLPFGCHAWEKYEPEFWSSFIKIYS